VSDEITLSPEIWSHVYSELAEKGYTPDEIDSMISSASLQSLGRDHYQIAVRVPPKLSEIALNIVCDGGPCQRATRRDAGAPAAKKALHTIP
jgi:hypothetical protein